MKKLLIHLSILSMLAALALPMIACAPKQDKGTDEQMAQPTDQGGEAMDQGSETTGDESMGETTDDMSGDEGMGEATDNMSDDSGMMNDDGGKMDEGNGMADEGSGDNGNGSM